MRIVYFGIEEDLHETLNSDEKHPDSVNDLLGQLER